ncbi:MAG: hypothetical protein HQ551_06570 [Desulfobacteraceae bacterium]|nr:hypothetical protein [Desulfobacteraceae bacterium]
MRFFWNTRCARILALEWINEAKRVGTMGYGKCTEPNRRDSQGWDIVYLVGCGWPSGL